MPEGTVRRRRVVILPRLQYKFAVLIGGALLVLAAFFEWDIYFTMKQMLPKVFFIEEIRNDLINFHMILAAKALVFTILVAAAAIYFSHRIAGPIYRLEKDILHMVAEADLTQQFRLRKNDELQELADALNSMVANLRAKLLADEQYQERIREGLQTIQETLRDGTPLTDEALQTIREQLKAMLQDSAVSPVQFKI